MAVVDARALEDVRDVLLDRLDGALQLVGKQAIVPTVDETVEDLSLALREALTPEGAMAELEDEQPAGLSPRKGQEGDLEDASAEAPAPALSGGSGVFGAATRDAGEMNGERPGQRPSASFLCRKPRREHCFCGGGGVDGLAVPPDEHRRQLTCLIEGLEGGRLARHAPVQETVADGSGEGRSPLLEDPSVMGAEGTPPFAIERQSARAVWVRVQHDRHDLLERRSDLPGAVIEDVAFEIAAGDHLVVT
jgi:hypothetical protein